MTPAFWSTDISKLLTASIFDTSSWMFSLWMSVTVLCIFLMLAMYKATPLLLWLKEKWNWYKQEKIKKRRLEQLVGMQEIESYFQRKMHDQLVHRLETSEAQKKQKESIL